MCTDMRMNMWFGIYTDAICVDGLMVMHAGICISHVR